MDIVEIAVEIAILGILFSVVEHAFRGIKATPWFRRKDMKTDVAYYLMNAVINPVFQTISIAAIVGGIAILGGASLVELRELVSGMMADDPSVYATQPLREWVGAFPLWSQILVGLLIADFFGYWGHRFFHKKPFWYMHAIHHSPPVLDWLYSARFHPLEDAVMAVLQTVPLLFLGFDPVLFVTVTPIIAIWSVFSHANLTWDLGPLKYIIVTPRFHRWHHTSENEGLDKNFSGLFPIYDLMFGTWYMPDKVPTKFGAGDTPVPAGLWQQLVFPFRNNPEGVTLARDIKGEVDKIS